MKVLVTGGAGYIGAHAVLGLMEVGHSPIVLDNFSTGIRTALPKGIPVIEGNVGDPELVDRILTGHSVEAVMHFAASVVAPDSVTEPLKYYRNNTVNTVALIESCVKNGVLKFIFSSTAAVYGNLSAIPIGEEAPLSPISPYGASKLMIERIIRDAGAAHALRSVILRYFNVAGADIAGRTGQSTPQATHLIKVACQTALKRRPQIEVFGTDYPTPDGTGIRDYIHVSDLIGAHILALQYLENGGEDIILNCGYGHGYSVREVLSAVERVTATPLPVRMAPRRPGDPASIVASTTRIREVFGWQPQHDNLDVIVRTALEWEQRLN